MDRFDLLNSCLRSRWRGAGALLLLVGLLFCASRTYSDGGIYPAIGLPTEVSIPAQEALTIYDGSQEVLILQIRFAAEGDSFGWIIPVPNLPRVEVADPSLFSALEIFTAPLVVTSDDVLLDLMLIAVLVLSFPVFALKKTLRSWIIAIMIAGFSVFFVGPCFMSMGARKATLGISDLGTPPAVTIHEARRVGPYDVIVLSSSEPHQLGSWFSESGFALPEGAVPILDEYIRENWYFVVSKLSSGYQKESAERQPIPLKLTFPTGQAVYPMRLTSLSSVESGVLVYVVGDKFYAAKHFRVEEAREITQYEQTVLEGRCKEILGGLRNPRLTRLYGSLSPSQMRNDVAIVVSRDQKERHSTVYTGRAKRLVLIGTLASLACVVGGLVIPNRLVKKATFILLACGCMALVRPWGLFAPYSRTYDESRGRGGGIEGNMYALQSALDEFASMARGHYPADLNTTVMEVLEQLGVESLNDTSIAGARGPETGLEGEVGSTGPALLTKNMRNPYSGHGLISLTVRVSAEDPPAFYMPGMVHYVPLDVDGCIASGFKIYGETEEGFSDRVIHASHWRSAPKAVEIDGKWGYVGRRDRIVVEPQFDWAGKFSEGLAPVMLKEKWGYADERGNLVIEVQFDSAAQFSDGLAAVRVGQLWGFVERSGDILIKPKYTDVDRFSEGLAAVKVGLKWGYVDKTGRVVIRPIFDSARRFSMGSASVRIGARRGEIDTSGCLIEPLE
jgi:hypothetical protein